MSRTLRKDEHDKVYTEGRTETKGIRYHCGCWLCTGYTVDKLKRLKNKLAHEDLMKQLKEIGI
jgi:hypothetical protein